MTDDDPGPPSEPVNPEPAQPAEPAPAPADPPVPPPADNLLMDTLTEAAEPDKPILTRDTQREIR
jgi:hypothetical protein